MTDIDKAALLEALGHDDAAKVLRALNDTESAPPPPEPVSPPTAKSAWEVEEDQRRAAGQNMLDQMRAQGIRAAGAKDAA